MRISGVSTFDLPMFRMARKLRPRGQDFGERSEMPSMEEILRESIGCAMVNYLKFAIWRGVNSKRWLKMHKVLRLMSKDDI